MRKYVEVARKIAIEKSIHSRERVMKDSSSLWVYSRGLAVAALALAGLTGPGVSNAEIQTQEGCVNWNAEQGCIVEQYCSLNTKTRFWACVYWDSRDGSVEVEQGYY